MLRNIIFTIVSFKLLVGSLLAQLPDPLPEQFTVTQRWFSLTSDFDIETEEYKFGYIHRKFLSWTVQYEFYDIYDQLEARAKARWLSWGAIFDVTDATNNLLGTVEERIFSWFPSFDIISPTGQKLAVAKLNFWGNSYTLRDPVTDFPIATLYRPIFRWKDNWVVTIENPTLFYQKEIDPRLFIIVMAFQSDREMWDSLETTASINSSVNRTSNVKKKIPVPTNSQVMCVLNQFSDLQEQLVARQETLAAIEPSDSDFKQVEAMVEAKLQFNELSQTEKEMGKDYVIEGLQLILPLLDSDELTDGEKKALYLLIEYRLTK